jgi:pimeloyl-ACP methyl ester carboxylesterase
MAQTVTPLIFLPGMMCDARVFGPQIANLGTDRTVLVAPITGYDTVQALAAEILQNAPPTFALAGLSMGGIVAMEVIAQAHDRVEKLALLDTNPRAEMTAVAAKRGPQIEAVKAGNLKDVMHNQLMPHYLADTTQHPEIMTLCWQMASDLGADVFIRQSIALRDRPDQQDTLRNYIGKTLVLCGRHDALCPIERHDLMHALLPNSTLEIVENAGHIPTLEQPEITSAALARWIKEDP